MNVFFIVLAAWLGSALLNIFVMTRTQLQISMSEIWLSVIWGPFYLALNLLDWDTVVWRRSEKK